MHVIETLKKTAVVLLGLFKVGIDGYLFLMIFTIASVGLAKIILKGCKKESYKYSNVLLFSFIGLIISILFKIFKIDLSVRFLEALMCLGLNIIVFVIFKNIKGTVKGNNDELEEKEE